MNSVINLSLAANSPVGNIAFIDLKAQQRRIRDRIEARLTAILDHGRYIAGPEIDELEELLQERTGASVAIACGSGTDALIIPLLARGLGPGDAVYLPAFTYNATANAVLLTGATPVFVDIDPLTFNIDPDDLERRIAETDSSLKPAAVIAVDLFGSPADYSRLHEISDAHDLFLLADAAQSYGGQYGNESVGAVAPVTSTSFFPGKALGAYGDAGAIFSKSEDDREIFESIRWHGTDEDRKESVRVGFNARMDSFQAAVLLEKIAIFDDELAARRDVAATYNSRFVDIARPQLHHKNAQSGLAYYSLCVEERDLVTARLKEYNVPTAIYYATPLHKMKAFSAHAPADGLPQTDAVAARIFSLPMHPYLSPAQVDFICDAVCESVKQ